MFRKLLAIVVVITTLLVGSVALAGRPDSAGKTKDSGSRGVSIQGALGHDRYLF